MLTPELNDEAINILKMFISLNGLRMSDKGILKQGKQKNGLVIRAMNLIEKIDPNIDWSLQ